MCSKVHVSAADQKKHISPFTTVFLLCITSCRAGCPAIAAQIQLALPEAARIAYEPCKDSCDAADEQPHEKSQTP